MYEDVAGNMSKSFSSALKLFFELYSFSVRVFDIFMLYRSFKHFELKYFGFSIFFEVKSHQLIWSELYSQGPFISL